MALDQSALLEVLDAMKAADVDDRIRPAAETIYQALIDAELTAVIGAGPHERTESRTAQRNGHRPRVLSTTAGDLELRIPKLRSGSFFPSLLERRRRVDQALFAVVMEAYLHGVSTRKVDDLVKALGADTGISKSEVVPDLRRPGRRGRRLPRPVAGRASVPVRVPRRHLLQGPGEPPGGLPGGGDRHRGPRRRPPGSPRLRCRRLRGRRVLDRVPALVEGPRAGRGAAGHLRRPHRAEAGDRGGDARRDLAALPGALPGQRARPGAQGLRGDGRRRDPHHLRPTRRRACPRAARRHRRDARPPVAEGRADAA